MPTNPLLAYVQHKYNCDWLQPMWHQGPCDCGLAELVEAMTPEEQAAIGAVSDHVRATIEAAADRKVHFIRCEWCDQTAIGVHSVVSTLHACAIHINTAVAPGDE
jgi:hypothetical protein